MSDHDKLIADMIKHYTLAAVEAYTGEARNAFNNTHIAEDMKAELLASIETQTARNKALDAEVTE